MAADFTSLLITDFDGTVTRQDFYALVVPKFLEPNLPDYWSMYARGELSHFEAMRAIFGHIRAREETVRKLLPEMQPDPDLADSVARLRQAGWEVEIVSAGCRWYIDQILQEAQVDVAVHASLGSFHPERGLVMTLDTASPFCSTETGIDKAAVVRAGLRRYRRVAFAGDGRPDYAAASLVEPRYRFARGWLAQELKRKRQAHVRFSRWSEIAGMLTAPEEEP